MAPSEIIRTVSIEFANFLTNECFYNVEGYMLHPDKLGDDLDQNEYQIDELYDYWIENIFQQQTNK